MQQLRDRLLGDRTGVTVIVALATIVVAWIGVSVLVGPRTHLEGLMTSVATDVDPCVYLETDYAGTIWTVTVLPSGYAAVAETFDPRFEPGSGSIVGPNGIVARYLDTVAVEGIPMPAATGDRCGFHRRVSVLTIKRVGFGP